MLDGYLKTVKPLVGGGEPAQRLPSEGGYAVETATEAEASATARRSLPDLVVVRDPRLVHEIRGDPAPTTT